MFIAINTLVASTSALVGVFGPVDVSNRAEKIDRATIQVTYQPASGRGGMFAYLEQCFRR